MTNFNLPKPGCLPLAYELRPCPAPIELVEQFLDLPHLLFLDSSRSGGELGRYSYIMAEPTAWYTGRFGSSQFQDPFRLAEKLLGESTRPSLPGLPPFQGGIAGLWSYTLNRSLEAIPLTKYDDLPIFDYALGVYDWVIAYDHALLSAWLIVQPTLGCEEITTRILRRCESTRKPEPPSGEYRPDISIGTQASVQAPRFVLPQHIGVYSNFDPLGYQVAVQRAVDYIHAGDCFQINLAQRLQTDTSDSAWELYRRLRGISPAPFAGYFDLGAAQLLSSSPERFLSITAEGLMTTRPIKGTRPRGQTEAEDFTLLQDLMTNPKDRAENVMIVDLLRNDLGRSAEYGTMRVPKVCEVESYPYVHHLVSEVQGQLKDTCSPLTALRAAFPGGSITGAPKVRAMELIAELEPTARGAYCGSIGYVGYNRAMDTNILIRTMTYHPTSSGMATVQFPVGGGIVADSLPLIEYEETLHKATDMLKAFRS